MFPRVIQHPVFSVQPSEFGERGPCTLACFSRWRWQQISREKTQGTNTMAFSIHGVFIFENSHYLQTKIFIIGPASMILVATGVLLNFLCFPVLREFESSCLDNFCVLSGLSFCFGINTLHQGFSTCWQTECHGPTTLPAPLNCCHGNPHEGTVNLVTKMRLGVRCLVRNRQAEPRVQGGNHGNPTQPTTRTPVTLIISGELHSILTKGSGGRGNDRD